MKTIAVLLFCLCAASAGAAPLTIGVMPFANNSLADREALEPLCRGLADMLSTELGKIQSLKVVERAQLDQVLREMALAQSGVLGDSASLQAGRLTGASLLLLGSFSKGFDSDMRIDTRIVNTATGETVKAEEVTGQPKKLFKLIQKLSFKIAGDLDLSLSKTEKKALETPDSSAAGQALQNLLKGTQP